MGFPLSLFIIKLDEMLVFFANFIAGLKELCFAIMTYLPAINIFSGT